MVLQFRELAFFYVKLFFLALKLLFELVEQTHLVIAKFAQVLYLCGVLFSFVYQSCILNFQLFYSYNQVIAFSRLTRYLSQLKVQAVNLLLLTANFVTKLYRTKQVTLEEREKFRTIPILN